MSPLHPLAQVIRATASDIDVARAAVGSVHQRAPVEDRALAAFLADPNCYLFVSLVDGEVVASLNGYCLRNPSRLRPQFLLYEIDVKGDWRRRGVGTALAKAFLAEARTSGASEVWVVTNGSNHAALAMYHQLHFVRQHSDDVMLSVRP